MTVEKLPPRRPFWQLQRERGNEGEKLKLTAIKLSHRCRTQAVRKPSTRAAWRGLEWRRTALVCVGASLAAAQPAITVTPCILPVRWWTEPGKYARRRRISRSDHRGCARRSAVERALSRPRERRACSGMRPWSRRAARFLAKFARVVQTFVPNLLVRTSCSLQSRASAD